MASFAVTLFYQFGLGLAFVVGFVFIAALIVISFIDLDVRIVPDIISLPGSYCWCFVCSYWPLRDQ